jgi:hypothetical protein
MFAPPWKGVVKRYADDKVEDNAEKGTRRMGCFYLKKLGRKYKRKVLCSREGQREMEGERGRKKERKIDR